MKNTIIQWDVVSLVNKYKTEEQFNVIYLNVCFFLITIWGILYFMYLYMYARPFVLSSFLLGRGGGGGGAGGGDAILFLRLWK